LLGCVLCILSFLARLLLWNVNIAYWEVGVLFGAAVVFFRFPCGRRRRGCSPGYHAEDTGRDEGVAPSEPGRWTPPQRSA
jgi:hypothetical protein